MPWCASLRIEPWSTSSGESTSRLQSSHPEPTEDTDYESETEDCTAHPPATHNRVRQALSALDLAPVAADKLVLVSTNYFTRDAREAISRNSVWRIALRDYDDIIQWLCAAPRLT